MTSATVEAGAFVRRKPPAGVRRRRFLLAVANHSLLIAAAVIFLAPFLFIVLTAFMTNAQALSPDLWPHPFRWHNFVDVFHEIPLWRYALNSLLYGGLATLFLLISSMIASVRRIISCDISSVSPSRQRSEVRNAYSVIIPA